MKPDEYGRKGARKTKRDRYWSVMLVGDHGRIIPFRRAKGLAIGGICLLVISIAALVVVSLLCAHQRHKLGALQSQLETVRLQAAQMRDEKDLYLTQLIAKQGQQSVAAPKKPPAEEAGAAPPPAAEPADPPVKAAAPKERAAAKPVSLPVKWNADIRRFKATYHPDEKVLKAEFRIYNTTRPKTPLAGRTVVVFKNPDDTPIHWLPVPRVQLSNGEPSGSRGRTFKINNYRTMQLRAYGQKTPVRHNTATVFVYSDKGELLISKDFGFNLTYQSPVQSANSGNRTQQEASPPSPSVAREGSGIPEGTPATSDTPPSQPAAAPKEAPAPPAPQPVGNAAGAPDKADASPVSTGNPPAPEKAGEHKSSSGTPSAPQTDLQANPKESSSEGEPKEIFHHR